jgi:hypothetical protein
VCGGTAQHWESNNWYINGTHDCGCSVDNIINEHGCCGDDETDCFSVCDGIAAIDECSECDGGGIEGACVAAGYTFGSNEGNCCNCNYAVIDCEGECGGSNHWLDCYVDSDGDNMGNIYSQKCVGQGEPCPDGFGSQTPDPDDQCFSNVFDACGICDELWQAGGGPSDPINCPDNYEIACDCNCNILDCADDCGGGAVEDCAGECNGNAVEDCAGGGEPECCGIPDGDCDCAGNVLDCNQECNSPNGFAQYTDCYLDLDGDGLGDTNDMEPFCLSQPYTCPSTHSNVGGDPDPECPEGASYDCDSNCIIDGVICPGTFTAGNPPTCDVAWASIWL